MNGDGIVFKTTNFAPGTETVIHRTVSLDFVAVIEGEMELVIDSGETTRLKPGVCRSNYFNQVLSFNNEAAGLYNPAPDKPSMEKPIQRQIRQNGILDYSGYRCNY